MSRAGRTLFYTFILTSLLLHSGSGWVTPASAQLQFTDCIKSVLDAAIQNPKKYKLVQRVASYNDLIGQPLRNHAAQISRDFDEALELLHPLTPSYPKKEFIKWFEQNPFTPAELDALRANHKTIGDALHDKARLFEQSKGTVNFEKATAEFQAHLDEIKKACGADVACHESAIAKVVAKNSDSMFTFSCLRGKGEANKKILTGLITGFAVSNAGMIRNQLKRDDINATNFQYEVLLNNIVWTPILGEIGCRNTLRNQTQQIGQFAEVKPKGFIERGKIAGKGWVSYMKYSLTNEASYMLIHGLTDHYLRDKEVNTDPLHLAKELAMYVAWDAAIAVPRNIFFVDPFYNKVMPNKIKPGVGKIFDNRFTQSLKTKQWAKNIGLDKVNFIKVGNGAYTAIDGGVRFKIGEFNNWLFNSYVDSASKVVFANENKAKADLKSAPPTQAVAIGSAKPVTPVAEEQKIAPPTSTPFNRPQERPMAAAISERAKQEAKAELKNEEKVKDSKANLPLTCRILQRTYESCVNRCMDEQIELTAKSKIGTPTCSQCVQAIDAYEDKCGSYL